MRGLSGGSRSVWQEKIALRRALNTGQLLQRALKVAPADERCAQCRQMLVLDLHDEVRARPEDGLLHTAQDFDLVALHIDLDQARAIELMRA